MESRRRLTSSPVALSVVGMDEVEEEVDVELGDGVEAEETSLDEGGREDKALLLEDTDTDADAYSEEKEVEDASWKELEERTIGSHSGRRFAASDSAARSGEQHCVKKRVLCCLSQSMARYRMWYLKRMEQ
jgi:hypothetical protein